MKKLWLISSFLFISFLPPAGLRGAAPGSDKEFLDLVGRQTFNYFLENTNPENGLVSDKASNFRAPDFRYSPASVAGVGFGLASLAAGVERGWIGKQDAGRLVKTTLRFFLEKMETEHGFFYHFVDMETGKRVWNCELSSIDTALFLSGALTAAAYFGDEEISSLAEKLYRRADWQWMADGGDLLSGGWKPESGFLSYKWHQYDESSVMYILALGSPTFPLKSGSWKAVKRVIGRYKGHELIASPPLFTHQFSHVFIDFRGKSDGYADYFLNSVEATLANRRFCMDNSKLFKSYGKNSWGLTASIGPDGYNAYGAPPGPASHDGTVAPSAAAASIVFTPKLSIAALRHFYGTHGGKLWGRYGFSDSFNLDRNFFAEDAYAINQGPALLMLENFRSGLIWKLFMSRPETLKGMKAAGFGGKYVKLNRKELPFLPSAVYSLDKRPSIKAPEKPEGLSAGELGPGSRVWKKNSVKIKLSGKHISSGRNMQPGYGAETFLTADTARLYAKIEVKDSDIVSKSPDAVMYNDDSIEIYIDSLNNKFAWDGADDYQIILSPGSGGTMRMLEMLHPAETAGKLELLDYKVGDDGYSAVISIDRAAFGIGKSAIGFSVAAHNIDSRKPSDAKYNWFFLTPAVYLGELSVGEGK